MTLHICNFAKISERSVWYHIPVRWWYSEKWSTKSEGRQKNYSQNNRQDLDRHEAPLKKMLRIHNTLNRKAHRPQTGPFPQFLRLQKCIWWCLARRTIASILIEGTTIVLTKDSGSIGGPAQGIQPHEGEIGTTFPNNCGIAPTCLIGPTCHQ